jgi:hypothetical protein
MRARHGVFLRALLVEPTAQSRQNGIAREERVSSYVLAIDQGTTSTRAILFHADTSGCVVRAMNADRSEGAGAVRILRVEGGMAASDWTMQRLADLTRLLASLGPRNDKLTNNPCSFPPRTAPDRRAR